MSEVLEAIFRSACLRRCSEVLGAMYRRRCWFRSHALPRAITCPANDTDTRLRRAFIHGTDPDPNFHRPRFCGVWILDLNNWKISRAVHVGRVLTGRVYSNGACIHGPIQGVIRGLDLPRFWCTTWQSFKAVVGNCMLLWNHILAAVGIHYATLNADSFKIEWIINI